MSEADIVQSLCGNGGAMEYDLLLELAIGFPDIACCSKFDSLLRSKEHFFLTEIAGVKRILAKTSLRLCKVPDCNDCKDLHLCKFYIHGECNINRCQYGHDLHSDHNAEVLSDHQLEKFSRAEIRQLLLQNDTPHTLLPPICAKYNHGDGEYGQCEDKDECNRLHVCEGFMRHTCDGDTCRRSHDLFEPQPSRALCRRGVLTQQVGSMRSVYHHILLLRGRRQGDPGGGDAAAVAKRRGRGGRGRARGRGSTDKDQGGTAGTGGSGGGRDGSSPAPLEVAEICLSFVKGFCKYENRCVRVHCKMPYLWQVRCGDTWSEPDNNEDIERDYCNPNCITTFSVQGLPVLFDSMQCGDQEVRRLSTAPSVQMPDFILTTQWIWYWRNEQFTWNPYIPPMCWDLEKRYQADSKDVFLFIDGRPPYQQQYQLSFRDMQQRNMCPGSKRRPLAVRRRPIFISAKDVQTAKTRKRRGRASSQPGRGGTEVKTTVSSASNLAQSHSSTPSASSIAVDSTLKTVTVSTPTSSSVTPHPMLTPPPAVTPPPAQSASNGLPQSHNSTLSASSTAVDCTVKTVTVSTPTSSSVTPPPVVTPPPAPSPTTNGISSSSVTNPFRDLSVDDLLSDLHLDPAQVLPEAAAVSTAKPLTPVPTSSRPTSDLLLDLDELISPTHVTNPSSHPQSPKYSDPAQVLPAAVAVSTAKPLTPVPTSSRSTAGSSALASGHPSQTAQTKHGGLTLTTSVDDLLLDLDELLSPTYVTNPSSHPQPSKSSDPARILPAASTVPTTKRQAPVPPSSKCTSTSSVSSSSHTSQSTSGSSVSPSSHLSQTAQTKYRDPSGDNWLLVDLSGVPKTRSSALSDPLRSTASARAICRAHLSSTAGSAAPPVPPASRRVSPPPPPPHLSPATKTSLSSSSSSSSSLPTPPVSHSASTPRHGDMYNTPVSGALPRSSSEHKMKKKKEEKCILL